MSTEIKKFGIQLPPELRQRMRVAVAQRDIQIRDAWREAVELWLDHLQPAECSGQITDVDAKDWFIQEVILLVTNPQSEAERGVVAILRRLVELRGNAL
jgi:hypothetical protein